MVPGNVISLPVVTLLLNFYTTCFVLSYTPSHVWLYSHNEYLALSVSTFIGVQVHLFFIRCYHCPLIMALMGQKKVKWLLQRYCNSKTRQHNEISSFLVYSLNQGTHLCQPHHGSILKCSHSCPKAQQCYMPMPILSLLPKKHLPPAHYLSFSKCLHFLSFNKSDFYKTRVFPFFFQCWLRAQ